MDEDSNGVNPFCTKLNARKKDYLLNLFDTNTHKDALALYPGAKVEFEQALRTYGSEEQKKFETLFRYRCLVWGITSAIQNQLQKKTDQNKIDELLSAEEGNHRTASIICSLLGSAIDLQRGYFGVGTLGSKWLTECLREKFPYDVDDIKENLRNVDFDKLTNGMIEDDSSVFNEILTVDIVYGVSRKQFYKLGLQVQEETKLLKAYSKAISDEKTNSIVPPETEEIAARFLMCVERAQANDNIVKKRKFATYSANGSGDGTEYYHAFPRADKIQDAKPDVFFSKQADALKLDGSEVNFKAFVSAHPMGLCRLDKNGNPSPTGKKVEGPVRLTDEVILRTSGKTFAADAGRATKWASKDSASESDIVTASGKKKKRSKYVSPSTKVGELYQQGVEHDPLQAEEFVRGLGIMLFHPAVYRAYYSLGRSNFENSGHQSRCKAEIDFLLRTHTNTESLCASYGRPMKQEDWKSTMVYHESWADQIDVTKSILSPDKRYIPATLFLAEALVVCLQLGWETARGFAHMISQARNDFQSWTGDRTFVNIIGEFISIGQGQIIELLYSVLFNRFVFPNQVHCIPGCITSPNYSL